MVDLYRNGLQQLAGEDGGHAKHLMQHLATLCTRHGAADLEPLTSSAAEMARELNEAQDNVHVEFTIQESDEIESQSEDEEGEEEELE